MGGSGSARSSGEYPVPVTQEQFNGFVEEARGFFTEQRTEMASVRSMLSDGQATMAVLRRDTAEYRTKSDEASSKIRLLIQNEAVRTDREKRAETVPLPSLASKPTFSDLIKDKFMSALAMVVVAVVMATGWTLLRGYVIDHPNVPGEENPPPAKHEHHGDRDVVPAGIPASSPASKP
jgi:hypothetical protein